jgi:hypothetical protein
VAVGTAIRVGSGSNQYQAKPKGGRRRPPALLPSQDTDLVQSSRRTLVLYLSERQKAAEDPNSAPALLVELARDQSWDVRQAVAWNDICAPAMLEQLAEDKVGLVRRAAAWHAACPPSNLEQLAQDPVHLVRIGVAANPSCPLPILERLLRDSDRQVAQLAANNQNLPPATRAMWQLTRV